MISISSTSESSKNFSKYSIFVLKKHIFSRLLSCDNLAPCQKRAPLMSIPIKFLLGFFFAKKVEYSHFPHPNSR